MNSSLDGGKQEDDVSNQLNSAHSRAIDLDRGITYALRGFEAAMLRRGSLWGNAVNEIQRIQREAITLQEFSGFLRAAATMRATNAELERKNERQRQQWETQLHSAQSEAARADARAQDLITQLQPQISQLQSEVHRARQEQSRAIEAHEQERNEVSRLRKDLSSTRQAHREELEAKELEVEKITAERDSAKASLSKAKQDLEISQSEQERLRLVLRAAEEAVQKMQPKEIKAWGTVSGAGTAYSPSLGTIVEDPEALANRAGLIPPSRAALLDLLRPAAWGAGAEIPSRLDGKADGEADAGAGQLHANARAAAAAAAKEAEAARTAAAAAEQARQTEQKEAELFSVLALTRQNRHQLQKLQAAQKELALEREERAKDHERSKAESSTLMADLRSAQKAEREARSQHEQGKLRIEELEEKVSGVRIDQHKSKALFISRLALEGNSKTETAIREAELQKKLEAAKQASKDFEEQLRALEISKKGEGEHFRTTINNLKKQLAATEEDFFETTERMREKANQATFAQSRRLEKLQVDNNALMQKLKDMDEILQRERASCDKSSMAAARAETLLDEQTAKVERLQSELALSEERLTKKITENSEVKLLIEEGREEAKRLEKELKAAIEARQEDTKKMEEEKKRVMDLLEKAEAMEETHAKAADKIREESEQFRVSTLAELRTLRARGKRLSVAEAEANMKRQEAEDIRHQLRAKSTQLIELREENRKVLAELDAQRRVVILQKRQLEQITNPVYGKMVGSGSKKNDGEGGGVSQAQLLSHERKKAMIAEEKRLREKAQLSEKQMREQLRDARAEAGELERQAIKAQQVTGELRRELAAAKAEASVVASLENDLEEMMKENKKLREQVAREEENTRAALKEAAQSRMKIKEINAKNKREKAKLDDEIHELKQNALKGLKADSATHAILKEKLEARTNDVNKLMLTQSKLQTRMVRATEEKETVSNEIQRADEENDRLTKLLEQQQKETADARAECEQKQADIELLEIKVKRQEERANRYRSEIREVTNEYKAREEKIRAEAIEKATKSVARMKKEMEFDAQQMREQLRLQGEASREQLLNNRKKYLEEVEKNRKAMKELSSMNLELEKEKALSSMLRPELERMEVRVRQANRACEDAIERGRIAEQESTATIRGLEHKTDALEEDLFECQRSMSAQEAQRQAEEEKMAGRTELLEDQIRQLRLEVDKYKSKGRLGLENNEEQVKALQNEVLRLRRKLSELGVVLHKPHPILGLSKTISLNTETKDSRNSSIVPLDERHESKTKGPPARIQDRKSDDEKRRKEVSKKRKDETLKIEKQKPPHNPNAGQSDAIESKINTPKKKEKMMTSYEKQMYVETLFKAAKKGNVRGVERCLKKGINPNTKDDDWMTALHWASDGGHLGVVQVLIENRKTNIDALTKAKTSALHKACWNGHVQVVKALLHAGCEVDIGDQRKHTSLHWAIHKGHIGAVEALLDCGAKSLADHVGRTPLHWASKHGRSHEVKLLLDHGADLEARDNDGDTPADVARREGFIELV
eukprot:g4655.t1